MKFALGIQNTYVPDTWRANNLDIRAIHTHTHTLTHRERVGRLKTKFAEVLGMLMNWTNVKCVREYI